MKQTLVGEQIELESRGDDSFLRLTLGAAEVFLQAAEASPRDLESTEAELMKRAGSLLEDGTSALHARLVLVKEGVEIHLWGDDAGPDSGVMVLCRT